MQGNAEFTTAVGQFTRTVTAFLWRPRHDSSVPAMETGGKDRIPKGRSKRFVGYQT